MSDSSRSKPKLVHINEKIPVPLAEHISPEEKLREGIPGPAHLSVWPEIARGGIGHVHVAADVNLLRHVALKRLNKASLANEFYREGFIAEAQIAGQLEHPNIVPVHELAVDDKGIPYFTMKLVQGEPLDSWLLRHPLEGRERLQEGLEIFLKICDAVAYAHHRGVIHRDLKPGNVMVGDFGQTYLMDWGLARLKHVDPKLRIQMNAGGPVGTPAYMSPEQARGDPREMDERSDIFGLGAMLYELASGQTPYGATSDLEALLEKVRGGQVVPIDAACARVGVSRRLRNIIERATAPDPAARFQTADELRQHVRAFLQGGLHLPRLGFAPGAVIVKEGDAGAAAYMIVSGQCRAYRTVEGREETLSMMGQGEVFGEMALLLEEPRGATVVAVDRVTVLLLDKTTMSEGLGLDGWTGSLVRALAHRFRALEESSRLAGLRRS
jgi:tRNA A-37 threonylcarbamoyl transferase component Bud32